MKILDMIKQKKKFISDLVYTVGASVLMNGVLQLLIYPYINRSMGEEYLGNVVFYMSIVYIIGQAMGMSFCSNRLVLRNQCETSNGDYNRLLSVLAPAGAVAGAVIFSFYVKSIPQIVAFGMIVLFTVLRYYANVEYRLKLNYKKYFLYFVILTAGYGLGTVIYALTGQWVFIFLTGEVIATLYMFVFGTIFKKEPPTKNTRLVAKQILFLLMSYLVFEGITNADRMILKNMLDAKAVALFYVVSMIGKTLQLFVGPINNIALSYMSADKKKMTREDFLKSVLSGGNTALCEIVLSESVRGTQRTKPGSQCRTGDQFCSVTDPAVNPGIAWIQVPYDASGSVCSRISAAGSLMHHAGRDLGICSSYVTCKQFQADRTCRIWHA